MDKIVAYIDGSFGHCGRRAIGGWAYILLNTNSQYDIISEYCESGPVPFPFSAELEALLLALRNAPPKVPLEIRCDSRTVVEGFKKRLAAGVSPNSKQGKTRSSSDRKRWSAAVRLGVDRHLQISWIKSHSDDEYNNKVDLLAVSARSTQHNYIENTAKRLKTFGRI